jgi:hypothetical protein
MTAARSDAAANIAAFNPRVLSTAFTSAPRSSNMFTDSTLPAAAANISGVVPFAVLALMSAPPLMSVSMTVALPCCAARISGV